MKLGRRGIVIVCALGSLASFGVGFYFWKGPPPQDPVAPPIVDVAPFWRDHCRFASPSERAELEKIGALPVNKRLTVLDERLSKNVPNLPVEYVVQAVVRSSPAMRAAAIETVLAPRFKKANLPADERAATLRAAIELKAVGRLPDVAFSVVRMLLSDTAIPKTELESPLWQMQLSAAARAVPPQERLALVDAFLDFFAGQRTRPKVAIVEGVTCEPAELQRETIQVAAPFLLNLSDDEFAARGAKLDAAFDVKLVGDVAAKRLDFAERLLALGRSVGEPRLAVADVLSQLRRFEKGRTDSFVGVPFVSAEVVKRLSKDDRHRVVDACLKPLKRSGKDTIPFFKEAIVTLELVADELTGDEMADVLANYLRANFGDDRNGRERQRIEEAFRRAGKRMSETAAADLVAKLARMELTPQKLLSQPNLQFHSSALIGALSKVPADVVRPLLPQLKRSRYVDVAAILRLPPAEALEEMEKSPRFKLAGQSLLPTFPSLWKQLGAERKEAEVAKFLGVKKAPALTAVFDVLSADELMSLFFVAAPVNGQSKADLYAKAAAGVSAELAGEACLEILRNKATQIPIASALAKRAPVQKRAEAAELAAENLLDVDVLRELPDALTAKQRIAVAELLMERLKTAHEGAVAPYCKTLQALAPLLPPEAVARLKTPVTDVAVKLARMPATHRAGRADKFDEFPDPDSYDAAESALQAACELMSAISAEAPAATKEILAKGRREAMKQKISELGRSEMDELRWWHGPLPAVENVFRRYGEADGAGVLREWATPFADGALVAPVAISICDRLSAADAPEAFRNVLSLAGKPGRRSIPGVRILLKHVAKRLPPNDRSAAAQAAAKAILANDPQVLDDVGDTVVELANSLPAEMREALAKHVVASSRTWAKMGFKDQAPQPHSVVADAVRFGDALAPSLPADVRVQLVRDLIELNDEARPRFAIDLPNALASLPAEAAAQLRQDVFEKWGKAVADKNDPAASFYDRMLTVLPGALAGEPLTRLVDWENKRGPLGHAAFPRRAKRDAPDSIVNLKRLLEGDYANFSMACSSLSLNVEQAHEDDVPLYYRLAWNTVRKPPFVVFNGTPLDDLAVTTLTPVLAGAAERLDAANLTTFFDEFVATFKETTEAADKNWLLPIGIELIRATARTDPAKFSSRLETLAKLLTPYQKTLLDARLLGAAPVADRTAILQRLNAKDRDPVRWRRLVNELSLRDRLAILESGVNLSDSQRVDCALGNWFEHAGDLDALAEPTAVGLRRLTHWYPNRYHVERDLAAPLPR